ncbi:MAG: hypothetical protein AB1765_13595, partial [Candidatus Hydrogenedentota bacterium]
FRRRTPTRLIWVSFLFIIILIKWFYQTMFVICNLYALAGIGIAFYRSLRKKYTVVKEIDKDFQSHV